LFSLFSNSLIFPRINLTRENNIFILITFLPSSFSHFKHSLMGNRDRKLFFKLSISNIKAPPPPPPPLSKESLKLENKRKKVGQDLGGKKYWVSQTIEYLSEQTMLIKTSLQNIQAITIKHGFHSRLLQPPPLHPKKHIIFSLSCLVLDKFIL
jgi:hypothetical protein